MNVKLTLTIEESIILKAKSYAKLNGRSLSDIVESYLKIVSSQSVEEELPLAPITRSLKGSFKADSDFNYEEQLQQALTEKYF
jgi:hypothetical protein